MGIEIYFVNLCINYISYEMEKNNFDPLLKKLDKDEQAPIIQILDKIEEYFPEQGSKYVIGYDIKIGERTYQINMEGFRFIHDEWLQFVSELTNFESFIVKQNPKLHLSIVIRFTKKGFKKAKDEKPPEPSILYFKDIKSQLEDSDLTLNEKDDICDLVKHFMFIDEYNQGSISTTVEIQDDHYRLIFSNIHFVSWDFWKEYLELLGKKVFTAAIRSNPFEFNLWIERNNTKKRKRREEDPPMLLKKRK